MPPQSQHSMPHTMSKPKPEIGRRKSPFPHANPPWSRTLRETVESIVIAFILAFLFRTFEAEAFVIPTGSMAPTLQGRHKDIDCPSAATLSGQCQRRSRSRTANRIAGLLCDDATCPMCRYKLRRQSDERRTGENIPPTTAIGLSSTNLLTIFPIHSAGTWWYSNIRKMPR